MTPVLPAFTGTPDGAVPSYYNSLTNVGGVLYGTTVYGGVYGGGADDPRGGTVSKVTP